MAQNPIPFVNSQQLQIPATGADFNNLINAIDGVLNPIFPTVPGATTGISFTPGSGNVTISPTGSGNVSLVIQPLANGNLVLFDPSVSPLQTGVIQVANSPSWVPIQGIAACPGIPSGKPALGMSDHITGYLRVMDWLGVKHALPVC